MELEYNIGESPISAIKLFSTEGSVNCVTVKSGGEQTLAKPIGHNEGEPHIMSLEKYRTREPSCCVRSEGRRESSESSSAQARCKQKETVHHSGGVCEDSMLESVFRRSRETWQNGMKILTRGTTSSKRKASWALPGVRILHSSDETAVMVAERRRGTYVDVDLRRKGGGDGR